MRKFIKTLSIITVALCLVNCSKNKIIINSESDLNGLMIGCQTGTTGESLLKENFPDIKIVSFRSANDALLSLKNRKIDAIMIDELPAKQIVTENRDLKIADLLFPSEEYAVAVRKGDSELLGKINATIERLKSDGTYAKMLQYFIGGDETVDINEPKPSADVSGGRLFMGTNAAFPPFEYTKGTEVIGFDATLGKFIADNYNKDFKIIDMSFRYLISALNAGAIDFIIAGMTVTDERKELVDFSIPYYISHQVIILRK